jgi:glycine betaine/proline transport system substrate-binding protein
MKHRIWIVLSVLALVLAACGGEEGGGDTTTPAEGGGTEAPVEGDGDTINIVANPWTASALNAEIAAQLIEAELGNPAEVVAIDENTMFTGLSDGSLDVVLEVWPSGVVAEEQAFIDDGSVVNIGELGAIGKIGWFTPQYVIDEHPELATWEGYQDPEVAAMFATAETGDMGRFLGTDPSYSQYDEAIIANLELPFR